MNYRQSDDIDHLNIHMRTHFERGVIDKWIEKTLRQWKWKTLNVCRPRNLLPKEKLWMWLEWQKRTDMSYEYREIKQNLWHCHNSFVYIVFYLKQSFFKNIFLFCDDRIIYCFWSGFHVQFRYSLLLSHDLFFFSIILAQKLQHYKLAFSSFLHLNRTRDDHLMSIS